ncbi:hypothetical protein ACP70R_029863 [Stipagrostis hirtigluma subsp. patula]
MGRQEGMSMVSGRIEGHISPQAVESKSQEKKVLLEQGLSSALPDKRRCFACNETSHSLDQCMIKEKLVTVPQLFGHATKFPFYIIQPSEQAVEKEKFYHHCLLIASNISNLDLGKVKDELQRFWKLSTDWELIRDCRKNFLASFSSEDDITCCLKHPEMQTYLDDKEVKFCVTRWTEGNEESVDLIRQWFLVSGVPRIYRNWKELFQVASAFGVLIDVDEESLDAGDKEPIRLKIALQSLDGAPLSHRFVFEWSSRMVSFTSEDKVRSTKQQNKELEELNSKNKTDGFTKEFFEEKRNNVIEMPPEMLNKGTNSENSHSSRTEAPRGNHVLVTGDCSAKEHKELNTAQTGTLLEEPKCIEKLRSDAQTKENKISAPADTTTNSNIKTEDTPKAEGRQSTGGSSISMTGQEYFKGIPKPPITKVYNRKGKKQPANEALNKIPPNKMDKRIVPESSSYDTRIGASTVCNMLGFKSCSQKEYSKELNVAETALAGEGPKLVEELGAYGEKKYNSGAPAAATINSKKKQTSAPTSKTEGAQLNDGHTKGVGMVEMVPGIQLHEKQYASKINARLAENSKEFRTDNDIFDSFCQMGLQENLLKGIYQYGLEKPSAVHKRGIVPFCKALDVIQQALFGTTVTLSCGVLQRLDYESTECQALVLVPTCDLAQDTKKVIEALGQFLGVKADACIGGKGARVDQQILLSRVHVVVGTPDRILDMLQKQTPCRGHIRMLVLDEADELLTGGFKDKTWNIIQVLQPKIQVGLFSGTFSEEALKIGHRFMNKPVIIIVPRDEELKGIGMKQFYVKIEKEELKVEKLCDLFDTMAVTQSIIFVNTKRNVKLLMEKFRGKGYTVSASHGGMNQHARDTAIQEFRSGSSRIIIATDLRGSNVVEVPVVINYDLPTKPVKYIRRVQQCGQSGRKGVAISFITRTDERVFFDIKRFCNNQLDKLPSNVADLLMGYGEQKQNFCPKGIHPSS